MAWPFPPSPRRPTAGCLWIIGGSVGGQPYAGWNGIIWTTAQNYASNGGTGRNAYIFAPYNSVHQYEVGVGSSYPNKFGDSWVSSGPGATVSSGSIYVNGNAQLTEIEGSNPRCWFFIGTLTNPSAGVAWGTGTSAYGLTLQPTGAWPTGGILGITPTSRWGADGVITDDSQNHHYTSWGITVLWHRYGPDGTDFLPPSLSKNYPVRVPWSYYYE